MIEKKLEVITDHQTEVDPGAKRPNRYIENRYRRYLLTPAEIQGK